MKAYSRNLYQLYLLQDVEDEDPPYPPEQEIEIPSLLQQQLKEDCVHITRLNKLVSLPRKPSVCDLLLQYHTVRVEDRKPELNVPLLREALDGLKTYFDVTLHDHLLYEVERKQFSHLAEIHAARSTPSTQDTSLVNGFIEPPPSLERKLLVPSEMYGPEHFLRLFGKVILQPPLMLFLVQIDLFTCVYCQYLQSSYHCSCQGPECQARLFQSCTATSKTSSCKWSHSNCGFSSLWI